ncbi:sensor histidine kinase [Novipirellula rosea]|uniref:Signal transduction histidine kinase subgroup 3 dimerisation and phosphoacceptor domain-containing protein n=1 Tax=Novipirellula rosea TaxID=1031540 RepID=A0ABP8N3Q6_9BACT
MYLARGYLLTFAAFGVIALIMGWWLASRNSRGEADAEELRLNRLSISALEHRLATIDEQLLSLAQPSMRTGVGAVGYRSIAKSDHSEGEWIQIDWEQDVPIDQIVLVPTIWRDTVNGFRADGFPIEFRILVGTAGQTEGDVVASYSAADHLLPRVAPLVISFPATDASWMRLEATRLSPRGWDGMYILQLSEILVFSGQENVALKQSVDVSSEDQFELRSARHKQHLVDGFVPYLMDAYEGNQSLAFVSEIGVGDSPEIVMDLEQTLPLSRIHLHATDLSDTVPQTVPEDFGIPRSMVVQGANEPGFSDAVPLCEYQMESIYEAGPIIMRRFPETPCRYVRLVVDKPYIYSNGDRTGSRIGFAEIELFANGQNVSVGKPVRVNFKADSPLRSLSALTDGNNLFGEILPIRRWMDELAKRHDLESERPLLRAELYGRYQLQKTNLNRLAWLAGLLGFVAVCTVLVERIVRQRAVYQTRQRIAADLHDELGANLHAIGLLGDLAQASAESPDKLKSLLRRIRDLTERSGAATRYCSNMLEAKGLFGDLMDDMRRTSTRMMADLEHQISFEGESLLRELKPATRIDLFLFYKECLVNILRHSGATRVTTHLKADRRELCLTITDNGSGLENSSGARVPRSLSRRSRLLGAQVDARDLENHGTRITLRLRTRKFWSGA